MFSAGGWADRSDDAAALSLKGRLLKDRANRASGPERVRLLSAAAEAYDAAHTLAPAPYRAINSATARLLAGNGATAQQGARQVLTLLDDPGAARDTPYHLAASRAEALLLLGDQTGAAEAMAVAAAADPDGWDDRAATLVQLREIIAAQGGAPHWLAPFEPPASLHFAGHMALGAGGPAEAALSQATDDLLARHRIGFGWGALAAGSDIVIAERLVAAGGVLHVVLPSPPDSFAVQSVLPAGGDWQDRFEALMAQAQSVRIAADLPGRVHDQLATEQAGRLAIGSALLNARRLGSRCVQWLVEDAVGGGPNTARQATLWPAAAGPQERIRIPRETAVERLFLPEEPDRARRLVTLMSIAIDVPPRCGSTALANLTGPIASLLRNQVPPASVQAAAGRWTVVLEQPDAALDLVTQLLDLPGSPPSIGLHLVIEPVMADPASGTLIAYGTGTRLAMQLQAMAPLGTALCSDALAVALAASGSRNRTEFYHSGEDGTDGPVHMLAQ
ncbi:MAG: hypothetical protein O9296_08625 [Novosphingobium sp.]|nr:hypothetical protein [Novosphingobium sp.]